MEELIRDNVERLRDRIAAAAVRSGRKADDVKLMAVTKTVDVDRIRAAFAAGLRLFGENRVQEAADKYAELQADYGLHLIGHLQRNKAKTAAYLFDCVQSIDKLKTAEALVRHLTPGRDMDVLLEVNTSGEESKYGFVRDDDVFRCVDQLLELPTLHIRGLMTIAPFVDDERTIRASFRRLRELRDSLVSRYPGTDWVELSMGMTSDFEIAVEEGSTMIRVGTGIFGKRDSA
jgi:hypothetical protein